MDGEKEFRWIHPFETQQELLELLVKGLDRTLTYQEIRVILWLSECDSEKRGVITYLIKELVERQHKTNKE